jgi:hypothetical protein
MSDPTPEERETILFSVANDLKAHTASTVAPIIGCTDAKFGELVGSGTFIKDGGTTYLITAAHVAKQVCKYPLPAHSAGEGRPPVVFRKSFFLLDKPSDLAAVEVDPSEIAHAAFDVSCLADSSNDLEDDILFIHGFAGKDSRFSAIANGILSDSLPYATVLGESTLPEFKPGVHFAIQYKPEKQKDENGKEVDLPPPPGLSGTAVWKANRKGAGDGWKPSEARIVGIVHKWDQASGSLVATRVEALKLMLHIIKSPREPNESVEVYVRRRPE